MKVVLEYIWLDANHKFRSKSRVVEYQYITEVKCDNIPEWNYDGSSTGQASGSESEIILIPVALYPCPFRKNMIGNEHAFMVWCETFAYISGSPDSHDAHPHSPDSHQSSLQSTPSNTRIHSRHIFNKDLAQKPWFGLEQEYFLFDCETDKPLGFTESSLMDPQGPYYCSVGSQHNYGRSIAEQHYQYCLYAKLNISGINAEVAPSQWEFQIGPCEGIEAGDHLWIARYILERVCESHNVYPVFHPKPLEGNWNGSGCHMNFSTVSMREDNGYDVILKTLEKMKTTHNTDMKQYGSDNEKRMTGQHETSDFNTFDYGVGNRGASVRIPTTTFLLQKGYFEDRRPSSNCDPYVVSSVLFEHVLNEMELPL